MGSSLLQYDLSWLHLGQEDPLEREHDSSLQQSCLENSMDRGAGRATLHGIAELDNLATEQCDLCSNPLSDQESDSEILEVRTSVHEHGVWGRPNPHQELIQLWPQSPPALSGDGSEPV